MMDCANDKYGPNTIAVESFFDALPDLIPAVKQGLTQALRKLDQETRVSENLGMSVLLADNACVAGAVKATGHLLQLSQQVEVDEGILNEIFCPIVRMLAVFGTSSSDYIEFRALWMLIDPHLSLNQFIEGCQKRIDVQLTGSSA